MVVTRLALPRENGVKRRVRILFAMLLAGCSLAPVAKEAAIIGGTNDVDDPAVVLLISYPADHSTFYTCSAVVISPTVLVTAAHCVDAANHAGYAYGAFLGPDASAYPTLADLMPQLAAASSVHAHPSYNPASPFVADIGVVIMAQPLGITPLAMARSSLPANLPGQAARLIGYGQTVYTQFNVKKHQVVTTVESLPNDDTVVVGDSLHHSCIGDSGGPALVMLDGVEQIVGVDSYTETTGCKDPAHYRRVDKYLPFLDTYAPPPPPDLAPPPDLTGAADLATAAMPHSGCSAVGNGDLVATSVASFAGLALLALWLRRRPLPL